MASTDPVPRTSPLDVGDAVPSVVLADQTGDEVALAELPRPLMVFFYPRANTPGCTTQACAMRDLAPEVPGVTIVGISPDTSRKQSNFDTKHELGYPLLADVDHVAAEAFGVWQEKKNYGKTYMGVVRSAFLIGDDGTVAAAFPKISPKDTAPKLLEALGELS